MLLLGLDIGTSAAKGLLADTAGVPVAVRSSSYPVSHPRPGWSEQDPRLWWTAATDVIRHLAADAASRGEPIGAVGLSGQMHGCILLPRDSTEPLRPALLWNDQRTARECAEIEDAAGGRRALVAEVGNAALTGFTLPKILWVRRHEPDVFSRTSLILTPKDYVRFMLTGRAAIDVGDAAGTLLMNVDGRRWSDRTLRAVNLDPALLPPIVESGAVAGRVTPAAAALTGLAEGTPVVAGSGDNMMGAVGAGVVRPGAVLATIGTSGVIYAHSDRPRKDAGTGDNATGRVHTMCAADGADTTPGAWCITGCTLSSGGALAWARSVLAPASSYEDLVAEAATAPPGCEGLVFLPYLTGERCPHPDPRARGGWIGLTARHTRAHLLRAVIEGVTFTLAEILGIVRAIGVDASSVRLGGGGARSSFWRQIQADVYGLPVSLPTTEEGPAYGAALLAGVGAGVWPSAAAACDDCIRITEQRDPDPAAADRYAPARDVHRRLYDDLKDRFTALSDFASAAH